MFSEILPLSPCQRYYVSLPFWRIRSILYAMRGSEGEERAEIKVERMERGGGGGGGGGGSCGLRTLACDMRLFALLSSSLSCIPPIDSVDEAALRHGRVLAHRPAVSVVQRGYKTGSVASKFSALSPF